MGLRNCNLIRNTFCGSSSWTDVGRFGDAVPNVPFSHSGIYMSSTAGCIKNRLLFMNGITQIDNTFNTPDYILGKKCLFRGKRKEEMKVIVSFLEVSDKIFSHYLFMRLLSVPRTFFLQDCRCEYAMGILAIHNHCIITTIILNRTNYDCLILSSVDKSCIVSTRNDVCRSRPMPNDASMNAPLFIIILQLWLLIFLKQLFRHGSLIFIQCTMYICSIMDI